MLPDDKKTVAGIIEYYDGRKEVKAMNIEIQVLKMICQACHYTAYELQQAPLDTCPSCGQPLQPKDHIEQITPVYQLTINQENGVPFLIVR